MAVSKTPTQYYVKSGGKTTYYTGPSSGSTTSTPKTSTTKAPSNPAPNPSDYVIDPSGNISRKGGGYVTEAEGKALFAAGLNADHIPKTTTQYTGPGAIGVQNQVLSNADDTGQTPFYAEDTSYMKALDVTQQKGYLDLQAAIRKNQEAMQKQITAQELAIKNAAQYIQPSAAEKKIQENLLGLRQELSGMVQGVQERTLDGAMLTAGMAQEISNLEGGKTRQSLVNMRAQTMASQQLQQQQEFRQQAFNQAKFQIEQGQQIFDNLGKMDSLHQEALTDYVTRYQNMTAQAQTVLSTVLSQVRGLEWEDLSPDTAARIAEMAARSGIPIDAIKEGMKLTKNEYELAQNRTYVDALKVKNEAEQLILDGTGITPEDYKAAQDAGRLFSGDPVIQRYDNLNSAYGTLLSQLPSTARWDQLSDQQLKELAGTNTVGSIVYQWYKMQNPDSARIAAMDEQGGMSNPTVSQGAFQALSQAIGEKVSDLNLTVPQLKAILKSANSIITQATPAYVNRVQYFQSVSPPGIPLPYVYPAEQAQSDVWAQSVLDNIPKE